MSASPKIFDIPRDIAKEMKRTGVWREDCPVGIDRLSLLEVTYCDFDGLAHEDGRLIVLDAAAESIARLFVRLFSMRFPIARMRLMHEYAGDDSASMKENNSSCFNQRNVEGQNLVSLHSYGLALDINPAQNPCLNIDEATNSVVVHGSVNFLNRRLKQPGMIEPIVPLVTAHGFSVWGGTWKNPIDYQHFQFPRPCLRVFDILSKDSAARFFKAVVDRPHLAARTKEEIDEIIDQAEHSKPSSERDSRLLEKFLLHQ